MNKAQVIELLNEIKGAYGFRFDINEHTAPTWYKHLMEQNVAAVKKNLEIHIQTSENAPTIKDLIQVKDKDLESRKIEIARNKWIAEGKNPDEFEYRPASND